MLNVRGIVVRFVVAVGNYFLQNVQTGPVADLVSRSVGTEDCYSWDKAAGVRN